MKNKNMLKTVIPVLVILAGCSISWAIATYRPALKSSLPESEIPMVEVIHVEPRSVRLNLHSQGVVIPRTEIDLVPEVAGQIVQLHPSLGAGGFFKAHDVLLTIDPRDYDSLAETLGIRPEAFNECLSAGTFTARVMEDFENGLDAGAGGSPFSVVLVKGHPPITIDGAVPYDGMKRIVEEAIEQAVR